MTLQHLIHQAIQRASHCRDLLQDRGAFTASLKRCFQAAQLPSNTPDAAWSVELLKSTGRTLLDAEMDAPVVDEIRDVIAQSPIPAAISDLHVWRVAAGKYACILGLTVSQDATADDFHHPLSMHEELAHVTIQLDRQSA